MNGGFGQQLGSALWSALGTLGWLLAASYVTAVLTRFIDPAAGGRRSVRALVQPLVEGSRLLATRRAPLARPDDALFRSAPALAFVVVVLAAWTVPLSPGMRGGDTAVALFLFIVLLGPFVIALANAGWGANGKYGLVGSMRAAAHLVSYEVLLGFAILGPAMAAESLSLVRIVEAQRAGWYVLWQPLGFVLYLASALFTIYRRPFDLPMAGSELAGGVLEEYAGTPLLLFRVALHGLLFLVSAVGAALYLGGWHGPPLIGSLLPGVVWMLLKTLAIVSVLLLVSRRTPRLRVDQMLVFAWKVLLPVAFVNLAAVGILMLYVVR
jgi:NADH-quinone oxidoreductase subunit H